MNATLHLFRGLPGSGKTTLALQELETLGDSAVRVNRDDLRTEVAGVKYHDGKPRKGVEAQVTQIQRERISQGLRNGLIVIVDDTNLNTRTVNGLLELAHKYSAEVKVTPVDVSVEVALERNRKRGAEGGRLVPEYVIEGMAKSSYHNGHLMDLLIDIPNCRSYNVPKNTRGAQVLHELNAELEGENPLLGEDLVLVDCDGTLANNAHHAAYAFGREGERKDYKFFFDSLSDAPVNVAVRDLIGHYRDAGYTVFMLTGRSDEAAEPLKRFVESSGARLSRVIAKRERDFRPDYVFKAEVLAELRSEGFNVVAAIDDRPQSIRVWDSEGIHVDRVDYVEPMYDATSTGPRDEPFVNTPHIEAVVRELL